MTRVNPVGDALKSLINAERASKPQVLLRISSKAVVKFLQVMQTKKYIDKMEIIDDQHVGKICVTLNGRLTKASVISPQRSVKTSDIEQCVTNFLPSKHYGFIILETSKGLMTHKDAKTRKIGGKLVGYFF